MNQSHIAVLYGGLSHERDVSLASGKAVGEALESLGHRVTMLDVDRDISQTLTSLKPDIAFNALHGTYGEDGCIQGILEFLRIPYTHSGVRASAIAMHKPTAIDLFTAAGIPCPQGVTVTRDDVLAGDVIPRPYVVKPLDDGSSVGVLIVQEGDALDGSAEFFPAGEKLLVEPYIAGRELTAAVMNGKALGSMEIRPKEGFYDYRNKYTSGMTDYIFLDAPEDDALRQRIEQYAGEAHRLLGCRGVSRADFRYDPEKDVLAMLEINTHPGMTATSLVPKMAAQQGIDFPQLVQTLIDQASLDHPG